MERIRDFAARLFTRKLWLAVGSFATFMAEDQHLEAALVVLAYLGIEGITDMLERVNQSQAEAKVEVMVATKFPEAAAAKAEAKEATE